MLLLQKSIYGIFMTKYFLFFGIFLCNYAYCLELVPYEKQSLSLQSDNDAYFEPLNYDRYYTAGHNLAYTSKEYDDTFMHFIGIVSPFLDYTISRFQVSIGQEIYTPSDKFNPNPPLTDAPYAGYLYANFMIQNRTNYFMESLSLNLGMVGPYALGKEAQDMIHSWIHYYSLSGWSHQLQNEFVVNAYYKAIGKVPIIDNIIDVLPYGVVALGNANTHLELGAKLRIGYGLNGDFGIPKATTNWIGSTSISDDFRIYLSGGIAERIVARDMFLQGNTFGGYKSLVTLNHFVYELELGGIVAWKGISLAYLWTYTQKEFVQQVDNANYATIRLEISF